MSEEATGGVQSSLVDNRGKAIATESEGFTEVRRGRKHVKATVVQERRVTNVRGPSKDSEIPEIAVTNSFGSLEENTEVLVVGALMSNTEGKGENVQNKSRESGEHDVVLCDKENLDPRESVNHGWSKEQGKKVVFGSGSGQGLKQNRLGHQGKKFGNGKMTEMGRPKQSSVNRPTRGLVFGPATGLTKLSANGKRLRVESSTVGRSGGFVITESSEVAGNAVGGHRDNGVLTEEGQVLRDESSGRDLVMHGCVSDQLTEKSGA